MSKKYHYFSIDKTFQLLKSKREGISSSEVQKRLNIYGFNKIPEKKRFSVLGIFLGQFKNPLIYILFFALIISFATKHYTDGWIISAVIAINTVVGFLQEYKANTALSRLKQMIKYKAKVLREGKEIIIKQEEVVPGDVIKLSSGDKIPADARLFEATNLRVEEAALTGESTPVLKHTKTLDRKTAMADRKNMVYMGTIVSQGTGLAVVVSIGATTKVGQIANLVQETKEETTSLQKQMLAFGKIIGIFLIVVNIFIFGLGVFKGEPFFEMFLTSVAMVVAAIPEGLLPAMTVILAVGMQKLAKERGLIRRMITTETLGSISVICSDKTGTLTKGKMRMSRIVTEKKEILIGGEGFSGGVDLSNNASYVTALKIGVLCNDAIVENSEERVDKWSISGNPTEKALLLGGISAGLNRRILEKEMPRVAEIPFESKNKYMATAHKFGQNEIVQYLKGAPERILSFISHFDKEGKVLEMTEEKKKSIEEKCNNLTAQGLRVIALAYKKEKGDDQNFSLSKNKLQNFVFVGFIALKDPIRPEVKKTIKTCWSAGIRPMIITGDHKLTALAVAKELGLEAGEKNVLEGVDMKNMSDRDLNKAIDKIIIFARVEPKHKIRIIKALQSKKEIVAMTGDGINDAPALKKADIGVAVGSGTDIAKETADLVLLDDNFKTIVKAIERGRGIFDNIKKITLYLLSSSFTEIILIGLSILFGLPLALLPVQILWMKIIEEPFSAMALAFDPTDKNAMKRKPRKFGEMILNKSMKKMILFFAAISDGLLFLLFFIAWRLSQDVSYSQTIAFVGLGIASRLYIFSARGLTRSIFSYNPFENKLVNWSTVFGFLMIALAIYVPFLNELLGTVPLGVKEWLILGTYAIVSLAIYEIGKKLFISKDDD
ncbi:MAG: HAD-IC family P-type ATPase [Candidatus Moraniibacteriota bacterium]